MIRFVECDNCGVRYFVLKTDKPVVDGRHFLHGVCDTCFMPMEVNNPFLMEKKDERCANGDKAIALEKENAELKENHKKVVARLLMKIAGLEKLVETANKLLKPKGGFTIKDIKFGGVKLEGIHKKEGK